MIGSQKQQPAAEVERDPWALPELDVPEPVAASPEGFPEELKDFTAKDGTSFTVRRNARGN